MTTQNKHCEMLRCFLS